MDRGGPRVEVMKILVLAPTMDEFGGIQSFTLTLVRALGQLQGEAKVRLLLISEGFRQGSGRENGLPRSAKARFLIRALGLAARWRPDLAICTHVGLAPVARLIRGVFRCPYWVAAHGIEVWGHLPYGKRAGLRGADKILAFSEFTRRRLIDRHNVPPARTEVFPPGFDGDLLAVPPDRNKLAGLEKGKTILTVGRLAAAEQYKGQDVVLRAMPEVLAKVPDAAYLIAGDGDDRPRLEALARELGIQRHVFFLGHLNRAELAACYPACDVFALPARVELDDRAPKGEGFGIVYLEAMAFGKPVVGPNSGAPAEFIRHGEHGLLVDPEDPARVAQALIDLLTSPESAGRMGRAAREWVTHHYSYSRFCERLRQMLNELT